MLEIGREKNIVFGKKVCQKLLDVIIKKENGPISLKALEAISYHPDILLKSL